MATSSQGANDKNQINEPKERQRVSVACLPCRAKRIRCDGTQPACNSCVSRSVECQYNFTENKRKPPSKRYVEALEARVRLLERQLAARSDDFNPGGDATGSGDAMSMMNFQEDPDPRDRDLVSEVSNLLGHLTVGDGGQLHYFGSQSNYHLLRRNPSLPEADGAVAKQKEGLEAVQLLGKGSAVSIELQEHLLSLFWTWQNPSNYVIHKRAFTRAFDSRTYGAYCTPLLLSAMFAVASRYSDHPELRTLTDDPASAGHAFFEQAKILLLYESQAPTVATVQAAVLMAIRAMSDNEEALGALGWLYCGNASRMAYNLGLNLDCSQWVASGLVSEEEAEVRKVTWWGSYTLDKLFSIALGRPGCTRVSQYTCPKPSLDHDVEFDNWRPEIMSDQDDVGSSMQSRTVSASHAYSECLAIASEAMDKIYAPDSRLSEVEIENIVASTDTELRAYYVNMPSHLRLPPSPKTAVPAHIYQLHLQYHVNIILLHRPLLKRCQPGLDATSSLMSWGGSHMSACRDSASEIVKLLKIYNQHYTMRYTSSVVVHIAFTAAIIHLIDANPTDSPHKPQAIRHLKACVEALQDMKATWFAWSSKALETIKSLAREFSISEACRVLVEVDIKSGQIQA